MFKSILSLVLLTNLFLHAQGKWSLGAKAGLVVPNNAKTGIGLLFKLNYNINENFSFYASIGNINYGFMKRIISEKDRLQTFDNERNHHLYNISFGGLWYLTSYKSLKPFLLGEAGIGYLEFNKYRLQEIYIHDEINTLAIDTQQNETKLLYNIGLGFGVSNKLSNVIDVNLTLKFSSMGGKDYFKIGEKNSFSTQILFGVKYNL